MPGLVFYLLLFAGVLVFRLCHSGIVWVEEGYPLAAAGEMLGGKLLYRDIWFDKPPLFPSIYLLWGAQPGWPLRLAGALFVTFSAWSVGRFARAAWGVREERYAAFLTAFGLTFWIPSAVMVLGPDLLLIPVQTAAVLAAWRGQALAAGLLAGFGLLINAKTLFLLPAIAVPRAMFVLGLAAPQMLLWPVAREYWEQVWSWGAAYSRDTFVSNPLAEGAIRTLNWMGFHATGVLGSALTLIKEPAGTRWVVWLVCAGAGVAAGLRFAPRYYLLLLPPVALLAARAVARDRRWLLALLLIPLIRFGPRYGQLAVDQIRGHEHHWRDLDMERDSRQAAQFLKGKGGTLLVWGYRPELYPLSGLRAGTPFLDSQPLTGVLADRHLVESRATFPGLAERNRSHLRQSRPDWIVDGLGPYNPELSIRSFPDLRPLMDGYTEVHRTAGTVIYRLK